MPHAHGQPLGIKLLFTAALLCLGACTAEGNEPRATGARTQALEAPATAPRTALLAVELGRHGMTRLMFAEPKEFAFDPRMATIGDPNVKLEVFSRTGEPLGVTEANVTLCTCPQKETHYHGDVEVPHETTVLLKVPYVHGDERIRVSRLMEAGPNEEPQWREVLDGKMPGGAR